MVGSLLMARCSYIIWYVLNSGDIQARLNIEF